MKSIALRALRNKKSGFGSCLVSCLKILIVSFLLLAVPVAPIAFAQTDKALENMEALLSFLQPKKLAYERVLEDRAKQILSTQLEAENYFITINAVMDEKKLANKLNSKPQIGLKSLGMTLSSTDTARQFAEEVTPESFSQLIKSTKVKLILDKRITKELEQILTETLKSSLRLLDARQDQIIVERQGLGNVSVSKLQERISTLTRDLLKSEASVHAAEQQTRLLETQRIQLETQKQQVEKARADDEARIRQINAELDRKQEEVKFTKEKIESLEKQLTDDSTPIGKLRKQLKGFELLVTLGPIAILLALVLGGLTLLFLSAQSRRSKTMIEGLKLMAGELQKSGGLLGASPQRNLNSPAVRSAASDEFMSLPQSSTSPGQLTDGSLEIARVEAESAWNLLQKNPYQMLSILKDWLSNPEGMEKFLAFSDAIGFVNASALWEKFPQSEIESLSNRMNAPMSKQQAYQVVTQVYRFAEARHAGRPQFFADLNLAFLVSVTDAELAGALTQAPIETAAYGLLFLPAERSARVLELIQTHEAKDLVSRMGRLGQMTEVDAQRNSEALEEIVLSRKTQRSLDVSTHIATVFDLVGHDKKQQISLAMSEDSNLSTQIRSKVVTMDDVMNLDNSALSELILAYSSDEISELIFTLNPTQQKKMGGLLSEKMVFAVRQEMQLFEQKPSAKRKAQISGQRLQAELIDRVKELIKAGSVDLNAGELQESESETQTGRGAA